MPEHEISYREMSDFLDTALAYLKPFVGKRETKFTYALGKMVKKTEKHLRKYGEKIEDLRVKYALTEKVSGSEQEALIRDPSPSPNDFLNGYKMTRENLEKFRQEQRSLDETKVKLDCHHATDVPLKTLNELQRSNFIPFVLPPLTDKEWEEKLFPPEEEKTSQDEFEDRPAS